MVRIYHIVPMAALLLASMAMVIPGGVVVEGQLEQAPEPGTATPFTISITKGGLEYFGRILISLPENCKLEAKQLHGGGMTIDEERQIAVISWLKLPETDRFDLLLDLVVAPDAEPGPRSFEWDFSFIRNNDRVTVRPSPFHFDVVSAGGSPAVAQIEANADTNLIPSSTPANAPSASAVRTLTRTQDGKTEVRIALHNMPEGGFVKLMEQWNIPCSAEILQGGGSVSQLATGGASFVWFDYQQAGSIVYQLAECPLSEPGVIIGLLSFVRDGQTEEISVFQAAGDETTSEADRPDADREESTSTPGVRFEVQVAATKNAVVTDYFEEKLNFSLPVEVEEHEGWYKFRTGSFTDYEDARNEREAITAAHEFRGPFVVARSDNQRISVQEALMRTGQAWIP